ncbi:alanine racemase [Neorhizobium sp. NCHU2750]|uniref:alanine racemase n=1 Tax=Neorhizobium sp. NCHU2750 TaxID=1825976 RepID=UPI000E7578ED|nr:alanine racemase [Neorhizobium sp. NCHU2750]
MNARMAGMSAQVIDPVASGYLTIDLGAIRRNYLKLAGMLAPARTAAVVKADAYGLGARPVAEAFYQAGCRDFFTAHFSEAATLRPVLADDAILYVLNGLQPGNEAACAAAGIIPVLNSLEQLRRWGETATLMGKPLAAAIQFDTGMSRLGLSPVEQAQLKTELARHPLIDIRFIMSHLASADEADSAQNGEQIAEMERIAAEFPEFPVCFANSGGVFLGKRFHHLMARPGIATYGGNPTPDAVNPMEPTVSLKIAVVQTRTVPAGAKVGYGATFVAPKEMRLATIAAGYADGLPRSLSDRGAAYYGDVRLPIVGRVSMDSMTVDISSLPEGTLMLGSLVEMIGPHQTLDDLAQAAGTISYEVLTSLGQRYQREYLKP